MLIFETTKAGSYTFDCGRMMLQCLSLPSGLNGHLTILDGKDVVLKWEGGPWIENLRKEHHHFHLDMKIDGPLTIILTLDSHLIITAK